MIHQQYQPFMLHDDNWFNIPHKENECENVGSLYRLETLFPTFFWKNDLTANVRIEMQMKIRIFYIVHVNLYHDISKTIHCIFICGGYKVEMKWVNVYFCVWENVYEGFYMPIYIDGIWISVSPSLCNFKNLFIFRHRQYNMNLKHWFLHPSWQ